MARSVTSRDRGNGNPSIVVRARGRDLLGWTRSIGGAPFRLIWSAAVLGPAGRGRSGAVIGNGIPVGIVGVGCARRESDEQAHGEIPHVRHPTTSSAPQPNCATQVSRLTAVTKSRQAVSWVTASWTHGRHSDPSGVGNVACPNQSRLIRWKNGSSMVGRPGSPSAQEAPNGPG